MAKYEHVKTSPLIYLPNIKRNNLVQEVFNTLREKIISGEIPEGYCFPPQEALGEQFGVSRTVIREALNMLSSLGLVESQQGRGTFVLSPAKTAMQPLLESLLKNEKSIKELMETRYYLERSIARLAARRATDEAIHRLSAMAHRMGQHVENGEYKKFAEDDLAFHVYLSKICGNTVLEHIINTIRDTLRQSMHDFVQVPGMPHKALDMHLKIIDAVKVHDPDLAEQHMKDHLADVIKMLHTKYGFDLNP